MDAKGCCSSKIRSRIPTPIPEDCKRGAQSEVSHGLISKPKSVRTAIVKPFSFAELSKELVGTDALDEQASSSAIPIPKLAEPSTVGKIQTESLKRQDASEPGEKTSVLPTKYKAHSGIPFVSSTKKCASSNPFNFRGKQKEQSLRTAMLSNKNTVITLPVARAIPEKKAPSKEAKPKALERNPKPEKVVKKLADAINPFLKEAPVATKSYAGHSGITFKIKRSSKTTTNPFTSGNNTKESTKP